MKKSFRIIGFIAVFALIALITACAQKEQIEETEIEAWETATAPETQPPETSAPTQAAVESESEKKKNQYELSKWAIAFKDVFGQYDDFAYDTAPEIGQTKEIVYFASDRDKDNNQIKVWKMDAKSVAIPEWGISKIAVDKELFPEDESSIVKITENQIKRYPAFDAEKEYYGNIFPDDWTHPMLDKTFFLDDMGYDTDQCFDDSILFPGAFSRRTGFSQFRIWRLKTDVDPKAEGMDNVALVDNFYPYTTNGFSIWNGGLYICDMDGYTYAFIPFTENNQVQLLQKSYKEQLDMTGTILLRIKDGLCEGILYESAAGRPDYKANAIFLHMLTFEGELTDLTGGRLCTGYYDPQ